MCRRAVHNWLVLLTMEKYISNFTSHNVTTIDRCMRLNDEDLMIIGIYDGYHRRLLLDGLKLIENSPELFVCTEPCETELPKFVVDDVTDSLEEFLNSVELQDLCRSSGILPSEMKLDLNGLDSSTSSSSASTPIYSPNPSPYCSPSPPPPIVLKSKQSELLSNTNKLTIVSKVQNLSSIELQMSFVCVACPSLKFHTASELRHHIFVMNDSSSYGEHKGGAPVILSYKVEIN